MSPVPLIRRYAVRHEMNTGMVCCKPRKNKKNDRQARVKGMGQMLAGTAARKHDTHMSKGM